jgi:cell division transport system permease protein
MSGSHDRLGGRPLHGSAPGHFEGHDEVWTAAPFATAPPHAHADPAPAQQPYSREAPQPPARRRSRLFGRRAPPPQAEPGHAPAPIVPPGSVTGRSLTLVISIMCFLASLTAATVYMINQSADAWLRDIASEVTVQVEPREGADTEVLANEVAAFLGRQRGVRSARALSLRDSAGLLEPWLGQSDVLKELPVPRLIAVEVDRSAPPDLEALRTAMSAQFKSVTLDDHRQWQQQIRTVTRSFALGGLAILLLVAAATTAIIISATKSAMASNREIVEVLHFIGATDRFISREFERHFLRLGVRAGLVCAISAMAVFALMPAMTELLGGGALTTAEMNRLLGMGALDAAGYVLLGIVVIIVAALCMLTSRFGVFRILNSHR